MLNSVGGPHREACQPGGLAGTVGTSSGRLTNFFGVAEESWSGKVGQKSWTEREKQLRSSLKQPAAARHWTGQSENKLFFANNGNRLEINKMVSGVVGK